MFGFCGHYGVPDVDWGTVAACLLRAIGTKQTKPVSSYCIYGKAVSADKEANSSADKEADSWLRPGATMNLPLCRL